MDGTSRLQARWETGHAVRLTAATGLLVVAVMFWFSVRNLGTYALAVYTVWLLSALLIAAQFAVSMFSRPFTANGSERDALDALQVVVLVPCFNESPDLLEASLRSMLEQSRPPAAISVVDDGSSVDYGPVERAITAAAESANVRVHWRRTLNHGKRYALINAARQEVEADIYVTVDSDSVLDPMAIEEGIKPFADERVQSVAGFLLVLNYGESWLARMMELVIVSWGQFERSALSLSGSVIVNSGACSFYRARILRERAADFLSETVFGRVVQYSDDSLLTLFALEQGRAVQQPTSFAFSMMPTELRPHLIQQTRWMRGAMVRAWWRFKYLPLNSVAYWVLVLKWFQFLSSTLLSIAILWILFTVGLGAAALFGLGWVAIQFAISSRYLALRRSDQTRRQRWAVFAMVPVMVLWQIAILHQLRVFAYATFARTGWGSRVGAPDNEVV